MNEFSDNGQFMDYWIHLGIFATLILSKNLHDGQWQHAAGMRFGNEKQINILRRAHGHRNTLHGRNYHCRR
jgi:hypothetical protein